MEAHQADQTVARTLKIAIVGGGPACRAFLEVAQRLSGLQVEVLGVADPDPQAPGLAWARSQGIFTCQDMAQLYGLPGLDLLIELTGSAEVRGAVLRGKPEHLPLVDHDQARLFADIHHRQLAAGEQLLASKVFYETVVNAIHDEITVIGADLRIVDANEALFKRLGRTREEVVGDYCYRAVHGREARCEDLCPVCQTLQSGLPSEAVRSTTGPDGTEAFFRVVGFPLRDASGAVTAVINIARDITARKRSEEALRESEQKYRLLIENIPDITWAADRDGRVVFVSSNVERIAGYTPTEVYENPDSWLGNVYPDDLERVSEAHRLLFEGHTFDVQYRFRCKDGHWIWVHDRAVATYEKDGERYAYGLLSDITERKRAEEALQESEGKYRTLFESSAEGFFLMTDVFLDCNQQACRLWACEREDIIGHSPAEFSPPVQPNGRYSTEAARERIEAALAGEPQMFYWQHRRKDGALIDTEVSLKAITVGGQRLLQAVVRDVSERQRAEEALKRSETLLRHIFSAIPDLLTVHDRDLNVVLSNWHGHDLIPEEVRSGHPKCYEAYMRREAPCEPCHAQEVFDTGTPKRFEINNPVDGSMREVNVYPVFDQAGQVVMVAEHMRDITERCRTEKRLVEETRFTEGIVDGCPVAMFVVDRDHKLVYWNRACEELTGLSREQMVGTDRQWEPWYYERRPVMADLVVDGDTVRLQQLYANQGLAPAPFVRDAYKGEGYFEKLGRHLYFLAAPVFDEQGQVLGAIETIQDVTETKRLEGRLHDYSRDLERTIAELESKTRKLEAQEASQRAYSELLKILNSIDINQILRRSLQRVVEQANCQLGLIYLRETPEAELKLMAAYSVDAGALDSPILQPGGGLPAKVVQEMRPIIIRDVSPEARLSFYLGFARATPRTVVGLPLTFRDQVLGALVVASLESLEEGTISFLENCLRQVSVAINNALAFAQIERQSQELADINRELAEASRLKSEFVANMSHELRTPLNSILGFSDILLKNKEGNLSERQVGNVEKIRRNGANLLSLINSILDLSKAEAGKIEAASEPTNLRQVVEECVESVRPLADKSGLALVLEPVEELPIVRSDPAKIGQVLMNLLSNAIKFTEEGRICVRVRKRRRREDPFEIAVEDTGIGIAPQHLDDIFKEFKQLDGAADRRYPGTGLGLTISKRLAELLGGEILVESEVGKGSTFTLRLPVRRHEELALTPARKPLAAALAPPRLVSGRKQVLVIGADADAAQLAEAQAEQLGCEVSVCASGQEGLRRAAEMAPDAVVLDLAVPDRNGWEVLGELKGKEPTRDLPVVAVSGGDDRKRAFYLGASEFVAKPVEPEQFRSALARVLRPGAGAHPGGGRRARVPGGHPGVAGRLRGRGLPGQERGGGPAPARGPQARRRLPRPDDAPDGRLRVAEADQVPGGLRRHPGGGRHGQAVGRGGAGPHPGRRDQRHPEGPHRPGPGDAAVGAHRGPAPLAQDRVDGAPKFMYIQQRIQAAGPQSRRSV